MLYVTSRPLQWTTARVSSGNWKLSRRLKPMAHSLYSRQLSGRLGSSHVDRETFKIISLHKNHILIRNVFK